LNREYGLFPHLYKQYARFHGFVHAAFRALIGRGVASVDIAAGGASPFFHSDILIFNKPYNAPELNIRCLLIRRTGAGVFIHATHTRKILESKETAAPRLPLFTIIQGKIAVPVL